MNEKDTTATKVTISLPKFVLDRVDQSAAQEGTTRSGYISSSLVARFRNEDSLADLPSMLQAIATVADLMKSLPSNLLSSDEN